MTTVDSPPRQFALSGQCDWHWVSLGKKEKVAGGHSKQDVGLSCTSPLLQLRTVTGTRAGGTCTMQVFMNTERLKKKRENHMLHLNCSLAASQYPPIPSPSLLPSPTRHTSSSFRLQTLSHTEKLHASSVHCPRGCSNGVCSLVGKHDDTFCTAAFGWHHSHWCAMHMLAAVSMCLCKTASLKLVVNARVAQCCPQ